MRLIFIPLVFLMTGCSSIPKEQKLISPQVDLINEGIVLGEVIRPDASLGIGFTIEELSTHQTYTVSYAKTFFMKLPPGNYQIARMSGFNRPIRPLDEKKGVQFTVKLGEVRYIGSIIGDYMSNQKIIEGFLSHGAILSKHLYIGFADVGITSWNFSNEKMYVYTVDNFDKVSGDFFAQYPEYKAIPIQHSDFIEPTLFKR